MAECRTGDTPISSGRWRLRLIGSSTPLLKPRGDNRSDIVSSFEIPEARDYYIPNTNNVIMRYKVVVSEDHLATLQFATSKSDVYIKLSIYDNGEEMLSVTGKGVASIPAFVFMKDRVVAPSETEIQAISRPGSKTCKYERFHF